MGKVLIITYYWPPSGGSGVQRWLKFTKYLPEFGWEPFIFTPENPSFEVKDESLVNDISDEVEVIKLPIWEPYSVLDKFKKKGQSQQSDMVKKNGKGFMSKLMLWARGNLLIPDPRKFWVKPSVKVLGDILASNCIDTIITTGPPHSMHLIGLKLKEKYGVKWLADFRDPWTQWDLFDNFYLSKWARNRHAALERKVLQRADRVISVSNHYAADLAKLGGRKVEVITNGFDASEFEKHSHLQPEEFVIRHVGVVDELRDPRPLLKAVKELKSEGKGFRVEFIGNINQTLRSEIEEDAYLKELVSIKSYIPHSEVLKVYRQSAVLLLILAHSQNAPGNIPGKLFEYLASQRPILAIGATDGDSAQIIKETGAGVTCRAEDTEQIKKSLEDMYDQFLAGNVSHEGDVKAYSRKGLTEKLVGVLDNLSE